MNDPKPDPNPKYPRLSRSRCERNAARYTMNASHQTGNHCLKGFPNIVTLGFSAEVGIPMEAQQGSETHLRLR
jgi:hypothetical protein